MLPALISTQADLLALLRAGETLLLPNARAARHLRSAFDRHQTDLGLAAWAAPSVFTWPQWTERLYAALIVSGAETRVLLNAAQQHLLWHTVIEADPPPGSLSSTDALATLAASAFDRAADFDILDRLRSAASTPDNLAFARWSESFLSLCRKQDLLPPSLLNQKLVQHVIAGHCALPPTLHRIGFAELSPSTTALLAAIEAHGTAAQPHHLHSAQAAAPRLLLAPNPQEELTHAAHWTRNYLETHGPDARVAIVTPTLTEDRAALDATLREVLAPELQSVHADLSSTPWQFSAGPALASLPIIDAALSLAALALQPLSFGAWTALLLSRYLCPSAERDIAARFDAQVLRQTLLLRPEISLSGLLDLAARPHQSAAAFRETSLFSRLRDLHTHLQREGDLTRLRSYAAWTDILRDLLRIAGWPGSDATALNASDYAATLAWESVLDLVATLDITARTVPLRTALDAVAQRLAATPLSPPATDAPVHVLSVADAPGTAFDAVLFLRVTDDRWPAPERAHPLLPFALQRALNMEGTDVAATTERARRLTADLIASAATVVFTCATEDKDGHLRPSPLITGCEQTPLALASFPADAAHLALDLVPDDAPLPPLPSPHVPGGTAVLRAQAACGFQAFAGFRLQGRELETPGLGLDASATGRILHRAMQQLWETIGSQQALRDLAAEQPPARLDALLRQIADDAVLHFVRPSGPWEQAYVRLHQDRLHHLLLQWLPLELQRGPFTTIRGEQGLEVPVGPLSLNVRYDRIDRVGNAEDAGFVVVDYKTGASGHPHDWEGDRPDDPQLPLYALSYAPGELRGLAFARMRAGEMKWLGLQAEDGILPASRINRTVDLQALTAAWRETLTQLAYAFADGRTAVAPKSYPSTCEHCVQRLLCRVDPATLTSSEEDDAAEAADA